MNTTRKLSYIFNVYGAVTGRSFDSLGEFETTERYWKEQGDNTFETNKKYLKRNCVKIYLEYFTEICSFNKFTAQ